MTPIHFVKIKSFSVLLGFEPTSGLQGTKYYYKAFHLIKLSHEWVNQSPAQLSEKRSEEKDLLAWVRIQGVLQSFCPNFHKPTRCHYLLEPIVTIPLDPNVWSDKNVFLNLRNML